MLQKCCASLQDITERYIALRAVMEHKEALQSIAEHYGTLWIIAGRYGTLQEHYGAFTFLVPAHQGSPGQSPGGCKMVVVVVVAVVVPLLLQPFYGPLDWVRDYPGKPAPVS